MFEPNVPVEKKRSVAPLEMFVDDCRPLKPEEVVDSKGNLVNICLFESYLSKCMLDNQGVFKNSFLIMISRIEYFFSDKTNTNSRLTQLLQSKPKHYNLDRELYSIFTCLCIQYPGYDSFQSLKEEPFNLSACCYLVKLIADKILKPDYSYTSSWNIFSPASDKRSPYSPCRPSQLFHETNRGVIDLDKDSTPTKSIGIVEARHQPTDLKDYFAHDIYPSMSIYAPQEDSYVAQWLRKRNLPIISGSSGSTELLFSRIFPLTALNPEETQMIVIGQTLDMVAQGHHSFFEAILVAEFFNLDCFPKEKVSLLSFYFHWIPRSILSSQWFNQFIQETQCVHALEQYSVTPEEVSPERTHSIGSFRQ